MAVDFNGTTEFFGTTTLPITATPLTMAGWFRPQNIANNLTIMSISAAADNNQVFILVASGQVSGDPVQAVARGGATFDPVDTTTGFSADTWQHACAVFASDASRSVFLNGGSKATETASYTPSGLNRMSAGVWDRGSDIWHMNGRLAELGLWNVALTDDQVKMLAAGVSPLRVRPDALVRYWPMYDAASLVDYSGKSGDLTVTGSPSIADHAPVAPQWGFDIAPAYTIAAAPAGAIMNQFQSGNVGADLYNGTIL